MKATTFSAIVAVTTIMMVSGASGYKRAIAPLVPSHSDMSSVVGTAAAKSEYSEKYPAWKAFSDDNSEYWVSKVYDPDVWISYEFRRLYRVKGYRLFFNSGHTNINRAPKHFRLETLIRGSWVLVDERCCETDWEGSEERTYMLSNYVVGQTFRLLFIDDNDDSSTSQIKAISLHRIQFLGVVV